MASARKEYAIMGTIYTVVLIALVIAVFAKVVPYKLPISSPDPPLEFGAGWTTAEGAQADASRIFECSQYEGQSVVISKQLPDTFYNDSYLNFNSKNVDFVVYVDDRVVYGFDGHDPFGFGGMESYFHHLRLDKSYQSQTITFAVTPAYNDASCFFADMAICSVNDYGLWYMQRYGLSFFTSLAIFFIGLIMLIEFFSTPREFHSSDTLALGVASLAFGVWSAIETQVPMLFFGSMTLQLLALDYVCLFSLPYPLMVFASSIMAHRFRPAEYTVFAANIICAVLVWALCLTEVNDWHQSLPIFYALFTILVAAIVAAAIHSVRLTRKGQPGKDGDKLSKIAVCVFLVSLVIDFSLYAISGASGVDAASLLRVGFVAMQVILLVGFMRNSARNMRAAAESKAMHRLAYIDALTGVGNRAAFERACDALENRKGEPGFDFLLACFDVDDLKKVNDSLGHDYGDKHLRAASEILRESYAGVGAVYRVGGDEFDVLVSKKNPQEEHERALARMRELEEQYNLDGPEAKLRISCGICLLSQTENHTMREVAVQADAAMYEDKLAHQDD